MLLDADIKKIYDKSDLIFENLPYTSDHYTNWGNGAFIGNGMIGAMIYKKTGDGITFELGRNDIEAHNHLGGIDWTFPRVPIGDIKLTFPGAYENLRMGLYRAVTEGVMYDDSTEYLFEAFCDAVRDILVIKTQRIKGDKELPLSLVPKYGVSPRLERMETEVVRAAEPLPPLYEKRAESDCDGWYQPLVNGDGEIDGGFAVAVSYEPITDGDIYFVSITHSEHDNDSWKNAVDFALEAKSIGYDALLKEHTDCWAEYYSKSTVIIPDKFWQKFYNIQMYKLRSATRGDMVQVIDSQGPWLTKTGWPGTWWNLNVQLSYSPAYTSNHLDTAKSLINTLVKYEEQFRKNAEPLVPDGMYVNRSTGRSCGRSNIPTYGQIFRENPVPFELGNFVWVMFMVYRHYRHSMDEKLLREVLFPMLRAAVNVQLKLLYRGEDGKLHLPPTISPEYPGPKNSGGNAYACGDSSYDISLLKWALETLIAFSDEFSIKDELYSKWKTSLEDLSPLHTNENGIMVADNLPFAISHRHYSHLLSFFPLHLLDMDNREERELAEKSMKHWMSITGKLMGYSFTGASNMASTLGDGEQAYKYLNGLKSYLLPNTMYIEAVGGPVIETPLSAAESIHYMLMQSHRGVVKIFPSIPKKWKNISFTNLLAEGAFEISARLKGGVNQSVTVKSLAGGTLCIEPNLGKNVKISGVSAKSIKRESDVCWVIDTKKGDEILFTAD